MRYTSPTACLPQVSIQEGSQEVLLTSTSTQVCHDLGRQGAGGQTGGDQPAPATVFQA